MTTPTTDTIEFVQGSVKGATQGMTSADLWKCPRDRITVDPDFNVRTHDADYKAHIRAIADSIKANGYMADKPLAGYVAKAEDDSDIIILTDGHSRLAAFDLAVSEGFQADTLPMVTKPRGTSMEDLTVALVTSNNGRPLSPYEIGVVCKRLVGYGMETADIAKRLGYGKAYVESLLDLIAAPKAIRDLVTTGKVSATLAVETIKKHGKAASKMLADGVQEATAKGKEKVTKKHVEKKEAKASPNKGKKVAKVAEQATLPGVEVDANVALLEKAAAWYASVGADTAAPGLIVSLLCALTGLTEDDVTPYLETTSTTGEEEGL